MVERTNDDWLAALRDDGPARESALSDLRAILMEGLRYGLVNWVNTAGPEFAPLAEDFTQEALLRILSNLDSFEGRSKFTTWAHKIVVRVALTELRRKRWQNRSLEEMLTAEAPWRTAALLTDPTPGPERRAERSDMLTRLQHIIDQDLTEKQRQAIQAVPVAGMPLEEAAARLGTNRNAMYKLLHDARLRIKQELEEQGLSPADILALFE